MAITTFDELKTAMADWSVRTDLTTHLPDFIAQAEAFFEYPPLRMNAPGIGGIRGNIQRQTGTLSTAANTMSRPSDYLEAFRFELTADTGGPLVYVSHEGMAQKTRSGTGRPCYWTVTDVIEFDVTPDSEYAYELGYYPSVAALGTSNATNWLLTDHSNVYLSACMYHLWIFVQDYQAADRWMNQYKAGAASANKTYKRGLVSQGPIVSQVA